MKRCETTDQLMGETINLNIFIFCHKRCHALEFIFVFGRPSIFPLGCQWRFMKSLDLKSLERVLENLLTCTARRKCDFTVQPCSHHLYFRWNIYTVPWAHFCTSYHVRSRLKSSQRYFTISKMIPLTSSCRRSVQTYLSFPLPCNSRKLDEALEKSEATDQLV